MKTLRLFVFLIGSISLLWGCGKIEDPQFKRLESFIVKKFGLQQTDIGFSITYYNPNNFGVNIKEGAVDCYIDSVYIGKFTQDSVVDVNSKSDFSIPLSGTIPISTVLKLNLTDLSNREVLLQANGSVKVGKAGIYITKPVTYRGKHKVDIRL